MLTTLSRRYVRFPALTTARESPLDIESATAAHIADLRSWESTHRCTRLERHRSSTRSRATGRCPARTDHYLARTADRFALTTRTDLLPVGTVAHLILRAARSDTV